MKINFSLTVVLFLSLIVLLIILYVILFQLNNPNNSDLIFNDNGAVTDSNGGVVATFTISEKLPNLGIRVINIYVPDLVNVSGSDLARLKRGLLLSEGLSEENVYIVFNKFYEFSEIPTENYVSEKPFDPYDPTSIIPDGYLDLEDQDLVGLDFTKYVNAVQPRTDNFDIYVQDNNTFLIVLKNGYTEVKFREEYFSQFSGIQTLALIFKTKADLVN